LDEVHAVARVVLVEREAEGVAHVDVAQLQGTLEADLRRRDFTIDALAVLLGETAVVDVSGGLEDLASGIVRMNDADVFAADPLRLLRCARIATELGFVIDAATKAEIKARAEDVRLSAGERQRDELARILAHERAYDGFLLLDELGLLVELIPELAAGRGVEQPTDWHAYDVFGHNLHAVEAMNAMLMREGEGDPPWMRDEVWRAFAWRESELRLYFNEELSAGRTRAALLKLAALLHDVAKPQTRTIEADGRMRFLGHAAQGAEVTRRVMRRLRFSSREIQFVSTLVEEHLRPVQLAQVGDVPTKRAVYRFCRDLRDALPAVLLLSLADAEAARGPKMTSEGWSRHVAYMNSLLVRSMEVEGIVSRPPLLSGYDLMDALGMPPGPTLGKLLESLREAEAMGEITNREAALQHARELAGNPEGRPDEAR
jgi:poly(A) polymerase